MPRSSRLAVRRTVALAALAAATVLTACGGPPPESGGPPGDGGAPGSAEAPASAAGSLDGKSPAEVCARIPTSTLDGLALVEVAPPKASGVGKSMIECGFPGPAGVVVARVSIRNLGPDAVWSRPGVGAGWQALPELGEGAYAIESQVFDAVVGHTVVARHPNGRIVEVSLSGADAKETPSLQATVAWYKAVAAVL